MSPKTIRRRMVIAARADLRRRKRMVARLAKLDSSVVAAAMECFESEAAAASWLLRPLRTLGSKEPVVVARTKPGKAKVIGVLRSIENGVFT